MRRISKARLRAGNRAPFCLDGICLSRHEALVQVCNLLSAPQTPPAHAAQLIDLFQITPEELTEAGVPYEWIKALERRAAFI